MDILRELLSSIKEGETLFRPSGNTIENLAEFQLIAKTLIHAYKMDYLEECKPLRENTTINGLYYSVYLRGGLTYKGEQYLNQLHVTQHDIIETDKNEDFIDIKPNFFGVGVNFNAIWRKYSRKK